MSSKEAAITELVTEFIEWLTTHNEALPDDDQGRKVMIKMNIAQIYSDYMYSAGNTWKEHLIMIFRMTAHIPEDDVIQKLVDVVSKMPLGKLDFITKMLDVCVSFDNMTTRTQILRTLSGFPFTI